MTFPYDPAIPLPGIHSKRSVRKKSPFNNYLSSNGPKEDWSVEGFPGGSVVKNLPASTGDTSLIPGPGGSHMLRSI